MKQLLALLLAISLCMSMLSTAFADEREIDSAFFQCAHWKPQEVDVSAVREIDGRLVGVVKLPASDWRKLPTAELRVDCPIPQNFTDEQRVTLHVSHQKITKRQLMAALKDVLGQRPAEDCGSGYTYNDRHLTVVSYVAENDLDSNCGWIGSAEKRLANDPDYDSQYEQARSLVRQVIERFGGKVSEDVFHATRRDAEHMILGSDTYASDATEIVTNAKNSFDEYERKAGRTAQEYTMVKGLYELLNLPVMDQYYWRDGKDWIGAQSSFQAAVHDDGDLRYLQIDGLLVIESVELLEVPAFDWRKLLQQAVARLYVTNAISEDFQEEGRMLYAQYSVITELKPCWVGMTADILVPGWCLVSEDRVCKDDSVYSVWTQYGDYVGLMEE